MEAHFLKRRYNSNRLHPHTVEDRNFDSLIFTDATDVAGHSSQHNITLHNTACCHNTQIVQRN